MHLNTCLVYNSVLIDSSILVDASIRPSATLLHLHNMYSLYSTVPVCVSVWPLLFPRAVRMFVCEMISQENPTFDKNGAKHR